MRPQILVTLIFILVNIAAARRCYEGYATLWGDKNIVEKECGAGKERCAEVFAYVNIDGGDAGEEPEQKYFYACASCDDIHYDEGTEMIHCNDCSYDLCNLDDHINGAPNLSVVMSMFVPTIYYMLFA